MSIARAKVSVKSGLPGRLFTGGRLAILAVLLCLVFLAVPIKRVAGADTVVSETQARRAAAVTILKTQFRQQGGFTSDRSGGIWLLVKLIVEPYIATGYANLRGSRPHAEARRLKAGTIKIEQCAWR